MNAVLADARRGHPGLHGFAVAMAGLAVVLAALVVVDQRVLMGAVVWVKPLKFALSFVAYAGALAWMLGQLRTPALRRTGWVIVVVSAVVMVIITGQAARGVRRMKTLGTPKIFCSPRATAAAQISAPKPPTHFSRPQIKCASYPNARTAASRLSS